MVHIHLIWSVHPLQRVCHVAQLIELLVLEHVDDLVSDAPCGIQEILDSGIQTLMEYPFRRIVARDISQS